MRPKDTASSSFEIAEKINNDDGRPEFLIPVVPAALAVLLGIALTLGFLVVLITENDLPAFLP